MRRSAQQTERLSHNPQNNTPSEREAVSLILTLGTLLAFGAATDVGGVTNEYDEFTQEFQNVLWETPSKPTQVRIAEMDACDSKTRHSHESLFLELCNPARSTAFGHNALIVFIAHESNKLITPDGFGVSVVTSFLGSLTENLAPSAVKRL